jgi:hypothetical protein
VNTMNRMWSSIPVTVLLNLAGSAWSARKAMNIGFCCLPRNHDLKLPAVIADVVVVDAKVQRARRRHR